MRKYIIMILCVLCLAACSAFPKIQQLPEQKEASRLFKVEKINNQQAVQASLLTVQYEANQWRWVQTDPLGAPIARLLLSKEGWLKDGFVMPNNQAQYLFAALATALNPAQPLFSFSRIEPQGDAKDYYINGERVWRIKPVGKQFWIELADQSQWKIEQLVE